MQYYDIIILIGILSVCLIGMNIVFFNILFVWWRYHKQERYNYKNRELKIREMLRKNMVYSDTVKELKRFLGEDQ